MALGVQAIPQTESVGLNSPVAFSRAQEGEQVVTEAFWVTGDARYSLEALGAVGVFQDWQLGPGDLLCCTHDPLQGFSFCGATAAVSHRGNMSICFQCCGIRRAQADFCCC